MISGAERPGVMLMTYGSPTSLEDVEAYLTRIRRGRAPDAELVAEFRRRYAVIGGSPLVGITRRQAAAVEERLGGGVPVEAGMRFSAPTVAESLARLAERGAETVHGIVLSPQYSPLIMGGYVGALEAAAADLGWPADAVHVSGAWHLAPPFITALGQRVSDALSRFPAQDRASIPILLTAHSLPRRVADQEPDYLRQLEETARAVADAAGLPPERWTFCWQSAGHEPGEWMKPDFADLMPLLAREGHLGVLVAPVQFLADHLEILYDIDVAARQQAEAAGLTFQRIESLNTHPGLIEALATVVGGRASRPVA